MTPDLQQVLDVLKKRGLPVTGQSRAAIEAALRNYSGVISDRLVQQITDKLLTGVQSIAHSETGSRMTEGGEQPVTLGETQTSVRAGITQLLSDFDSPEKLAAAMNLDFKIGTASDVLQGAGRFVTAQTDVDEYPAWALSRFYDRTVPRGFRAAVKGALIPVPDDDWPARWAEAGPACGDSDWLPWEGDSQTGRGVALKSSNIWATLGNLRDDSLGNPYPPFAFNSGFDVDGVPRKECVTLGLLDAEDKPEGANFDWHSLVSLPEDA
ncbi:MAG: hypothetical protein KGL39_13325 [Patescibacteria group bacterium]|nr:hypothetical protein [Patescibacteria group bacterium]